MDRFTEAATVPFRSLHMGRPHTREESFAVNRLQTLLKDLQSGSALLPTRLMARRTAFSPPTFFGPFEFGNESVMGGNPHFGRLTDIAVRRFQDQVVGLEVDGKAGMQTLGELQIRIAAIAKARGRVVESVLAGVTAALQQAGRGNGVGRVVSGALGELARGQR